KQKGRRGREDHAGPFAFGDALGASHLTSGLPSEHAQRLPALRASTALRTPSPWAGSALVQLAMWRAMVASEAPLIARAGLANRRCCSSAFIRRNRSPGCWK